MSEGAIAIANERTRQLQRFDDEHDDQHAKGELVLAAISYAGSACAAQRVYVRTSASAFADKIVFEEPWPWSRTDDKRHRMTRRGLLVAAGAMLAAEIDRLDREANKPTPKETP